MYKVFCFCVILFCLAVHNAKAMSEEMKELAAMLHNTCQAQSGVSDDILAKGQNNEFPEDRDLMCYIKCLMTETAVMDEGGDIDIEAAVAMLPDELQNTLGKSFRKCGTVRGADPCETAFLSHKCVYEDNPDAYFLI